MKENQKRLDSQLSHIPELLHKFTNQPTTNPQPQPSTSSPLPSQPLPNPKGGINMVHNENDEEEDEEDDDEWLYGLLAELADSDDYSDDEDVEEEPEREVDDEEVEEETKGETFFIATIFRGNKVKGTEMPVKCEDPGPCLVTSKIQGVDILECLCDLGSCSNVMPYTLYETLDLSPLKKSKEVFTTVDASIVPTKGEKGGRPQVLLGRPFLKTARFKLQYDDDTFSLSVGKITEIFHVTRPPAPRKKGAHQLRVGTKKIEPEKLLRSEKRKESENPKNVAFIEKGVEDCSPSIEEERSFDKLSFGQIEDVQENPSPPQEYGCSFSEG
ncbi:hypothetical protein PIB30_077315 [Stylosanthes scabra]|uniref:Uncharacterized protein n=1 Tax=Stylosanthes scabra TaxID=79078 RepID=A0ABU6YQV3_9FABA|nr:hypothetical protein [Stylosanthes scabra]